MIFSNLKKFNFFILKVRIDRDVKNNKDGEIQLKCMDSVIYNIIYQAIKTNILCLFPNYVMLFFPNFNFIIRDEVAGCIGIDVSPIIK